MQEPSLDISDPDQYEEFLSGAAASEKFSDIRVHQLPLQGIWLVETQSLRACCVSRKVADCTGKLLLSLRLREQEKKWP